MIWLQYAITTMMATIMAISSLKKFNTPQDKHILILGLSGQISQAWPQYPPDEGTALGQHSSLTFSLIHLRSASSAGGNYKWLWDDILMPDVCERNIFVEPGYHGMHEFQGGREVCRDCLANGSGLFQDGLFSIWWNVWWFIRMSS